jgi:ATP adenylyltransferase
MTSFSSTIGSTMRTAFPFLKGPAHVEHPWDEVLFDSPNFAVVPTVGAIVEGWLLIVTKQHALCMGAIDSRHYSELNSIKEFATKLIIEQYGSAVVFEHGPAKCGQTTGCGTDHAHLHIVPVEQSLIDGIPNVTLETFEWERVHGIEVTKQYFTSSIPYLYVEQPLGEPKISSASQAPSQLFRKVIANQNCCSTKSNWRDYPMTENVLATVSCVKSYLCQNDFVV